MKPGGLIISLDFELLWGLKDKATQSDKTRIAHTHQAIPKLLALFKKHNIKATWATVGLLFNQTKSEIEKNNPSPLPVYENQKLNNYSYQDDVQDNDQLHFGMTLIKDIITTPGQELSTHTYSHYYCLEKGPTINDFNTDLTLAKNIQNQTIKTTPKSIVFPRNQYSNQHLEVCHSQGILTYRGNQSHYLYKPRTDQNQSLGVRLLRLIDAYLPLTKDHSFKPKPPQKNHPTNIPASRFLRPYSKKLKHLEWLKVNRIKNEMTKAAKKGNHYHLWWHPHNFGSNTDKNLHILEHLITHYNALKTTYNFQNWTMEECAQ